MGERFLAFLCDTSIEAVLVAAFLALYAESSLDSDVLPRIAPFVIPWLYMTLSEVFFHRTIGKGLLRIQLRSDSTEPGYPSFFRILLRETLGKFVSGLILGIGFLAGGWHEKHKTWADRMANTVVVRTGTVSGRLKAVLAVVLICANLGISYALTQAALTHAINAEQQFEATEGKIENVHGLILFSLFGPDPRSAKEYQQTVTVALPLLDEYSRLLADEQKLALRKHKLFKRTDSMKFQEEAYKLVIALRQEFAVLARRHVDMVLAFDPHQQTWNALLQERDRNLHELSQKQDQINEARKVFFPQEYKFSRQDSGRH